MKKVTMIALALFTLAVFSGMADAKLTKIGKVTIGKDFLGSGDRGGGPPGMMAAPPISNEFSMIYDDELGIIWIDYSSGRKEWPDQVSWAAGLNEPGALTYSFDSGVTVTWTGDWRLPKTVDGSRKNGYDGTTTAGFNITSSEMGHLFYKSLGNVGYYDTKGKSGTGWFPDSVWGLKNTGPFKNLQAGIYWSGTQYAIHPNHAWQFNFYYGSQDNHSFTNSYAHPGMAVRQAKVIIK